jgi:hypothetical protein
MGAATTGLVAPRSVSHLLGQDMTSTLARPVTSAPGRSMLEPMSAHTEPGVTRDSALEVLAFLVTAARTQTEEAAEYGPMRLLMAARLLAQGMAPYAVDDPALRALVDEVAALEPVRTPTRDREQYLASLDALCERVADTLLAHEGRG